MRADGQRIVKFYQYLDNAGFLLACPSDDDLVVVADDFDVARAGEKDHDPWMFVERSLVGNFLYIDIEDGTSRQVDGFGVHQIAFEEKLYPIPILGDAENQPCGISDAVDQLLA